MLALKLGTVVPPAVDALALAAAFVLPLRKGARVRYHFDSPLTQCICCLLFVISATAAVGWVGYLHQLAVLAFPVLATHSDGFVIFGAANLAGIYSELQNRERGIWVNTTIITMHAYVLLARLSAQEREMVWQAVKRAAFAREIQLVRLSHLRELVLDDIWQLPDRFRLHVSHSEFKYDPRQPLFIIRAIIGMAWRPMLPLILLKSLFEMVGISQTIIFGRLLRYVDEPSKHEWYEYYWLLLGYLVARLLQSQKSRLEAIINTEDKRVIEAIRLELFRLPLSNSALKNKDSRGYYKGQIQWLLYYLTNAYSRISSIVSGAFMLWLVYRKIGWAIVTPMCVTAALTMLEWGLSFIETCKFENTRYYSDASCLISEIYFGMKSIKFYGWERKYLDTAIKDYDEREAANKYWYAPAVEAAKYAVNVLQGVSSNLSIYLTIALYLKTAAAISNSELLLLVDHINGMRHHLFMISIGIRNLAQAVYNNNMLEAALKGESISVLSRSDKLAESGPSMALDSCSFAWNKKRAVLKNITFGAGSGELVAVVGKVASGKSSLLLAMCSEVEMTEGSGQVHGTIGYVEQSPWIMNGTLRDNITFGREFDEDLYWRVVHACALMSDIDVWPERDLTEIGDRGINISGGQKARLALARAVYSQADIYILDDPLSAVDEQVKRHLLDNVIMSTGILGNKLRIVSTNSGHIIPFSDQVIHLKERTANVKIQKPKDYSEISRRLFSVQSPGSESSDSAASDATAADTIADKQAKPKLDEKTPNAVQSKSAKESDNVDWGSIWYMARLCGIPVFAVILLPALLRPIVTFIGDSFQLDALKANDSAADSTAVLVYLGASVLSDAAIHVIQTTERFVEKSIIEKYLKERITTMFLRGLVYAPMTFFDSTNKQEIISAYTEGSDRLTFDIPYFVRSESESLLSTVLACYRVATKAPQLILLTPLLAYLTHKADKWATPAKKGVKRITKRSNVNQMRIFDTITDGQRSIRLLGVEGHFINEYIDSMDRTTRLKLPRDTLGSLWTTIYKATRTISSTIVIFTMLLQSQLTSFKLTSGELKTCERLFSELAWRLTYMVGVRNRVVDYCNHASVLRTYAELEPEASHSTESVSPPSEWPTAGKIEFRNYSMRYKDGLDLSLKDVSLIIHPGEKVGIVGRTGAGKSSLTRALFRLCEGASGSILVDGEDISKLNLGEMRPRIGIIPQDSALFSGTARGNLDPLHEFTIEETWAALVKCSMAKIIAPKCKPPRNPETRASSKARNGGTGDGGDRDSDSDSDSDGGSDDDWGEDEGEEERGQRERWEKAGWLLRLFLLAFDRTTRPKDNSMKNIGLRRRVSYQGHGFSAGQRQLFSLCRALLRRRKILVLDEATADVDLETDKAMHDVIHNEFKDCTILTIAHRLDTVMSSDRIIVMDQGRVAEFDTPKNLIAKGGLFAQLVETSSIGK